MKDFEAKLETFIEGCQKLVDRQYADSVLPVPVLSLMRGKKYIRVVKDDTVQKSAYCFIDMSNGNVLKCAGWKAPAKGARGNIFNEDNGLKRMSAYGAAYNRG